MLKAARLLPVLVMLAFGVSYGAAQEGEAGWPVVERCVGEPTEPPEGWTFPGAILMTGYAGIHGVNAAWETPQVLIFLPRQDYAVSQALSPNGQWFAYVEAESSRTPIGVDHEVYEITVASTKTFRLEYSIPWQNNIFISTRGGGRRIRWLDNEHLIYDSVYGSVGGPDFAPQSTFVINPFTGDTQQWEGELDPLFDGPSEFVPSADWERAIVENYVVYPHPQIKLSGLYNPITGYLIAALLSSSLSDTKWSTDGSRFAIIVGQWDAERQLIVYDRNGKQENIVLNLSAEEVIGYRYNTLVSNIAWSADNQYLAFVIATRSGGGRHTLYIADFEHQVIINTCVSTINGLAPSPDGAKLALLNDDYGQQAVQILDLETWALYTVAYHDGDIIGWRGD